MGTTVTEIEIERDSAAPAEGAAKGSPMALSVVHRIVADRHDRPSLVSTLACEIGTEIIEGVRNPGDDLNSVDLSIQYATSRTPIREALMLLEKEGLVDVPPRRRPRVKKLEWAEIQEIYKARAALLQLVVREVALTATVAQQEMLAAQVEVMREACAKRDFAAYLWANVEFHEKNTQIANNKTVKRILDSLLLRTLPLRRISLSDPKGMTKSCEDHLYLLRAYADRDQVLAAAIIHSNHMNALARLRAALGGEAGGEEGQEGGAEG
jgi:DNA-binding GntR family transcriptional regulator